MRKDKDSPNTPKKPPGECFPSLPSGVWGGGRQGRRGDWKHWLRAELGAPLIQWCPDFEARGALIKNKRDVAPRSCTNLIKTRFKQLDSTTDTTDTTTDHDGPRAPRTPRRSGGPRRHHGIDDTTGSDTGGPRRHHGIDDTTGSDTIIKDFRDLFKAELSKIIKGLIRDGRDGEASDTIPS